MKGKSKYHATSINVPMLINKFTVVPNMILTKFLVNSDKLILQFIKKERKETKEERKKRNVSRASNYIFWKRE